MGLLALLLVVNEVCHLLQQILGASLLTFFGNLNIDADFLGTFVL